MVRNYTKKSNKKKTYDSESFLKAIDEISEGYSIRSVSKKYSIPFSTLLHAKKGTRKTGEGCGRPTAIPLECEEKLAKCLQLMEKWGWGLSRKEVLEIVGEFVKKNNIKTPFKDNVPGEDWFLAFKKRHRLSIKKPQSLEYARKKATDPFVVFQYFDLLAKTIEKLDVKDKPNQIYNIDETSFCLDASKTKVVGEINKPSSRIVSGPGRESTTVLFGANAAGEKLPPLIIFKGKNIWDTWMASKEDTFPKTTYAASQNGWMESDIFNNYFEKSFIPNCVPERPILLIYDGHSTHLGENIVSLAVKNDITILKLPPHSSHLLQPLDLAVYKSLKVRWDNKLSTFHRKNVGIKIPKKHFATLVGSVWSETSPEIIKKGFEKGGVFPFNCNVVGEEKFDPEALQRYKNRDIPNINLQEDTNENPGPSTSNIITEHKLTDENDNTNVQDLPLVSVGSSSQTSNSEDLNVSFEDLLLNTVKQCPNLQNKKRRKISKGAEVITEPEGNIILQEKDEEKKKKKTTKPKKVQISEKRKKIINKTVKSSKIKQKKTQTNIEKSFYSDDSESECIISDSGDDIETMEDLAMCLELEDNSFEELDTSETHKPTTYKIGNWVLVKFAGKSTIKHYVAQIVDFEEEEPIVKCTRKKCESHGTVFIWPKTDDVSNINLEDIVVRLPEPILGRREELQFKLSFAGYNIQ